MNLDWIYTAISWILLRWHDLWDLIIPDRAVLGTNWSWILSIVFLVVTLRVILFPLFVKQIKSQRAMQALQPKMKELQEKYKDDKEQLQVKMMELYRTEKANPLMGCLPMFLQVPVFLGLFWILRRLDPGRTDANITLYGWTAEQFHDASVAQLFTAPISATFGSSAEELAVLGANGTVVKIIAGVLVLAMMATTFLTTRQMIMKTGRAEDPQQAMIQKLMLYGIPLSLLVSGAIFPIGVVIYWVTNNLFSLAQQQWVLRKYPPPPTAKKTTGAGKSAPAGKAKNGKAQPAKAGLLGRKAPVQPEPKPVNKALAPKPGAKPVRPNQKRGSTKRKG
ncbi:membrane protein insertase YidC [Melissospora conviva]|uniref:membrane protein insertase YidC n=1 Tax=Melissospora conviva TaxID=3388432 RepID=UPI003B7876F0